MRDRADALPPTELLHAFGQGDLHDPAWTTVERHVEACDDCRQVVATLPEHNLESLVRQAAGVSAQPARARCACGPGLRCWGSWVGAAATWESGVLHFCS
jgi:hypothetical protein